MGIIGIIVSAPKSTNLKRIVKRIGNIEGSADVRNREIKAKF